MEKHNAIESSLGVEHLATAIKNKLDQVPPVTWLYHYTDASGVQEILQPTQYQSGRLGSPWDDSPVQCFRATNVRFLNDRMELR